MMKGRYTMKNKSIFMNLFTLLYPFIPTLILWYIQSIQQQAQMTYDMQVLPYYVTTILFYIVFTLYVYVVIVRKYYPNFIVLIVGVIELLLLQFTTITYTMFGVMQGYTSMILYGALCSIYVLALLLAIKERKNI